MNGAGSLVEPLLGLPHWVGVIIVGVIVICIVATAGMTSTTYVQFLKGGLLLIFSTILVGFLLVRGLGTQPESLHGDDGQKLHNVPEMVTEAQLTAQGYVLKHTAGDLKKFMQGETIAWYRPVAHEDGNAGRLDQWETARPESNGQGQLSAGPGGAASRPSPAMSEDPTRLRAPARSGPFKFISLLADKATHASSSWHKKRQCSTRATATTFTIYYPRSNPRQPKCCGRTSSSKWAERRWQKLEFRLADAGPVLRHGGPAAHPDPLLHRAQPGRARGRSTIVAIAAIGFFYVLTLYMGLGAAMVTGTINPADNNMSAPLLARSLRRRAVRHHLGHRLRHRAGHRGRPDRGGLGRGGPRPHGPLGGHADMNRARQKVRAGKVAAFVVGIIAIILGIMFRGVNVSFLVGWAFAVAASANLPAILMMLFWPKTTSARHRGVSIIVGIVVRAGHHPDRPGHVRRSLRADRRGCVASPGAAGHHLHPAELPDAGGGVVDDAEEAAGHGLAGSWYPNGDVGSGGGSPSLS